ncbi:MAG TPA: choice-of-anchor tandem repeat GloVer-containing protein [Candidatus Cybelea sp.]|jgi:hypothetical protein
MLGWCNSRLTLAGVLAVALAACIQQQAAPFIPSAVSYAAPEGRQQERLIYNFPRWRRGGLPEAGLVAGDRGEMYGATDFGGKGHCHDVYPGCGIVFKLTSQRGGGFKESTAYNFQNDGDGSGPQGLVRDRRGALYGLTSYGYMTNPVLFRLAPTASGFVETTIHQFGGLENPSGSLTITPDGSLYGTDASFSSSYGMIFRFVPSGKGFTEQILYQFKNGVTGIDPTAPLLIDSSGTIYGTTSQGGTGYAPECLGGGCGTIFMLTPSGDAYAETVLYDFKGTDDGAFPNPLVSDGSGTFYASAGWSGGSACIDGGCGTLFSFNLKTRKLKVLHHFTRSGLWAADSKLIFDRTGALYGTAAQNGFGVSNGGVFKLARRGNGFVESTIHAFAGSPNDGQFPRGGLLLGPAGKAVYGTTFWGGKNIGTVFEVKI